MCYFIFGQYEIESIYTKASFSFLRTRKVSRGVLAYADFLTESDALCLGRDKMDTREKVSWFVVEQQSQ
jgi:hypothetical protein